MIDACDRPGGASPCAAAAPAALQEGWVIANHILVSFHVAFISSVLALPPISLFKWHVLRFVFASPETLVSAVFAYLSFPRRQEPAARDPRADHPAQPLSQQSATASPAAPLPPHYAKPVDPGRQAEPHRPPWTDTIDLAERYIPGSDIVNELRRTSHHALGKRPLLIAQAYHAYLASGATEGLISLGLGAPARADVAARSRRGLVQILQRVVDDLQRLLGTAEIITRIEEWQEAYVDALMRCDFGSSIEAELERILAEGVRGRNRWVYYHHLRILACKADGFSYPAGVGTDLRTRVGAALTRKPDADGFDAPGTARELTDGVAAFVQRLREEYQAPVFVVLEEAMIAFRNERFFEAFQRARELRGMLVGMIDRGGFDEQRYYLCQLEGLLEEMGYLALGHVATRYQEEHVDIQECLAIIRLSALNLRYDGLESRDLSDLVAILDDPTKTDAELLDVLDGIEQVHHRIRQRVTVPYEKLKDRLALQPDDLRLILANMQRYLPDLNSMVQFADLAATVLREGMARGTAHRSAEDEAKPEEMDHIILHLSHRHEIAR